MTEAPAATCGTVFAKRTVGEELFLVHLSRYGQEPHKNDHDREDSHAPTQHHPSTTKHHVAMTPGEELWRIHCQRSRGVDLEKDSSEEKTMGTLKGTSIKKLRIDAQENAKASAATSPRTISLRNREVEVVQAEH